MPKNLDFVPPSALLFQVPSSEYFGFRKRVFKKITRPVFHFLFFRPLFCRWNFSSVPGSKKKREGKICVSALRFSLVLKRKKKEIRYRNRFWSRLSIKHLTKKIRFSGFFFRHGGAPYEQEVRNSAPPPPPLRLQPELNNLLEEEATLCQLFVGFGFVVGGSEKRIRKREGRCVVAPD